MTVSPTEFYVSGTGLPDTTEVTLTVTGMGQVENVGFDVDVMLVLDKSGSMGEEKIEKAKQAAVTFLGEMGEDDRSGLVSFNSYASLDQGLTYLHISTKNMVNGLYCYGGTAMSRGIEEAQDEIRFYGRASAVKVMIVLSDGVSYYGGDPAIAAKEAKDEGTVIYAIGLGKDADEQTLKEVATDIDHYYFAPDGNDLTEIYEDISNEISNIAGTEVVVTAELTHPFEIVPYSLSIPGEVGGAYIQWRIDAINIDEVWEVTFELRANECGEQSVIWHNVSEVRYTGYDGRRTSVHFPERLVDVLCPTKVEFSHVPETPVEGEVVQFTDMTQVVGDNTIASWDWDFGDGSSNSPQQNPTHEYADDGVYEVQLEVLFDDGRTDTSTSEVKIVNADPTVGLKALPLEVGVAFRIAGEKWHDVIVYLNEDGIGVEEGRMVRQTGSPNEQMLDLGTLEADISKNYTAIVKYTPEDDPVNGQPDGANPCWVILNFGGDDERWIHHTFKVGHPETRCR
jgi:PKD repeat protein/uncharacterized protein YegL